MDKLQQLRTLVKKRHDDNWEKSYNGSGGNLYWERALEDVDILAIIDSIPRFKVGDVIKSGSYTYTIKDMDEDSYILEGDKVLTFNAQYDWKLVEESQRMVSAKAKEAGYSKPASKDFTFKSIPRILEMAKPSERAKSYCEKLAKSLENEGYPTDAKIVRESIKMMNGEKVPMATMNEEPVSEDLEEASEEWLRPQLDMSYINYGEGKMMELTHFDGYAMLDAIEFGAKWKEEQMMKNVVLETTIIKDLDGCAEDGNESEWLAYEDDEVINMPEWCEEGDKVKLILIKSK